MTFPAPRQWDDASSSLDATHEELRREITDLREAVAARDTFIAVAAHELRNPMTPMIGQIELLLSGMRAGKFGPEQIQQRLGRIHRVMNHYLRRANALLDVSRLNCGQFRLLPTSCDLVDLLRDVVETFAEPARYAGSPIGLDVPSTLPGLWDRLAMEQIIDNLVSNAVKYGGQAPIVVRAESLRGQMRLTVRDHGPGISADDRRRIFERFERAVGPNQQPGGFGVGLWVVGQIVGVMGGTVEVEDAAGGGSEFIVSVPHETQASLS